MNLVSLKLWLENRNIDKAKIIAIIEGKNILCIVSSPKVDPIATSQKFICMKSRVIERKGNQTMPQATGSYLY